MVKDFTTKRREKVDRRRESIERREKSKIEMHENEGPVHDARRKETKRCKFCGAKHRIGKQNCPALAIDARPGGIMNLFPVSVSG